MTIFEHLDYKIWLRKMVGSATENYGLRKRVADAAGCQKSYLSSVMNGKVHLTLEHTERLCRFWNLSPAESEYLILLVNYARAGSQELQKYFRVRLKELKEKQENFTNRVSDVVAIPEKEAAIYYSSWQYLAIHILISIPEFNTVKSISQRLQVSEESTLKVLRYLEELQLAETANGKWKSTRKQFHLSRDSMFSNLHHSHWRNRAVDNAFLRNPEDIHYTAVSSLAKSDVEVLRQLVLKMIDNSRTIIGPSNEEEMICLNLDLFKV